MSALETVYAISPSPESTIALEITQKGLRRKRYAVFFESFEGVLTFNPAQPDACSIELEINGASVVCRDKRLSSKEQKSCTQLARAQFAPGSVPTSITFESTKITHKPLRGFILQGVLQIHGVGRQIKANVAFGEPKNNRLQIDADAALPMSNWGVKPPSSWFGLAGVEDEVLVRILVWGTAASDSRVSAGA